MNWENLRKTSWSAGPAALVLLFIASTALGGVTTRVSVTTGGSQTNNDSAEPDISADGRYVAFQSSATNIVAGVSVTPQIYVHDRVSGVTSIVSVDHLGNPGTGGSWYPSISADGRYVSFTSKAENLLPPGRAAYGDIFVHDRQTGGTTIVSGHLAGPGDHSRAGRSSISGDGATVAFRFHAEGQAAHVHISSVGSGHSTIVSMPQGGTPDTGGGGDPCISSNGKFVAFSSSSSDLAPVDTNGKQDVFVYDRAGGGITRVSVANSGAQSENHSVGGAITPDGRYIAFSSEADNLIPNDTHQGDDVFVRDRAPGETTLVSMTSTGEQRNGSSTAPAITPDGRYVAFLSRAILTPGDVASVAQVYLHDRQTGETTLISRPHDGTWTNGYCYCPSISDNARYVAFGSDAHNLVPGDTNGRGDIFVYDRLGSAGPDGDMNEDGLVNANDMVGFFHAWRSAAAGNEWFRAADMNDDDALDAADAAAFLDALLAAGP